MKFLKVNFENKESILRDFDAIADRFSRDLNIKINEAYYRIVDFEFYVYSAAFPDPHTYKNNLQLQNGKFYLHSSGVDITFGDGINHGGILLRGLIKLHDGSEQDHGFMKEQFDGPHNVATELFSNLNPLNSFEKNDISLVDVNGHNQDAHFYPAKRIIKTKRVGLTPKPTDKDDFYKDLPIRYIAVVQNFPKFKLRIKGIESLLGEQVINGQITVEEARDILGYNKSFA